MCKSHHVTTDKGVDGRTHHNPDDFASPIVKVAFVEKLLAPRLLEQHVAEHAAYHERIALILKRAALDHDLDKVALLTLIREVTTTHVLGMDALSKDYLV